MSDPNHIFDPFIYGTVIIPANLNARSLDFGLFSDNPLITRVVVPNPTMGGTLVNGLITRTVVRDYIGILEIRSSVFVNMPNLREVYLPSTLAFIGTHAFSAPNSRVTGTTTALRLVDFSQIKAPIAVDRAAFQFGRMLGVRGNHFTYTFDAQGNEIDREFHYGFIMVDGEIYLDDGRGTPAPRAVPPTGTTQQAALKWHSVDGPAFDENGFITDPSDTFYRRWTNNRHHDGTRYVPGELVAGTFDLRKVAIAGQQSFSTLVNLKYMDLSYLRATGTMAFTAFGQSVGSIGENFGSGLTLESGRPGSDDFGPDFRLDPNFDAVRVHSFRPMFEVSVTFSKDTAFGIAALHNTGINTKLVIPFSNIPPLGFAVNLFVQEIEFTGQDIVISSDAFFVSMLIANRISFTGEYVNGVWVPASVKSINTGAFTSPFQTQFNVVHYWINVREIYFGQGVTVKRIESEAFVGFWQVHDFVLPNGLEYLGRGAFVDAGFMTLTLPQNFYFGNSFELSSIGGINTLLEYTTEFANIFDTIIVDPVGNADFRVENNILLQNLNSGTDRLVFVAPAIARGNFVIPASVSQIAPFAFAGSNVTSVTISSSITISAGIFANSLIQSVTLGDHITYIPDFAFDGATRLTSVTAQGTIRQVGEAAFRDTAITNFDFSSLQDLTIEDTVVRGAIGVNAFENTRLTAVVLGQNIRSVPTSAFEGTRQLTSIDLNAVTHIGTRAFANSGLQGAVTGESVVSIGQEAFNNSRSITSAVFNQATSIGSGAFAITRQFEDGDIGGLSSVSIPSAVTISSRAFANQSRLNSISALDNVTRVGTEAFINAPVRHTGTQALSLPAVRSIGNRAFANNIQLRSFAAGVYLGVDPDPYHLAPVLNNDRDRGATGRSRFVGMGNGVFSGAASLLDISAPNNDTYFSMSGVLFRRVQTGNELVQYPGGRSVANYTVPEGTVRINDRAFEANLHLTRVTMPSTLRAIGDGAFFNTRIDTFEFRSFVAPSLEAIAVNYTNNFTPDTTHGTRGNDQLPFSWALYSNFVNYFTPPLSAIRYAPVPGSTTDNNAIGLDESRFIFNSIAPRSPSDLFAGSRSDALSSLLTGTCWGLTIVRPLNGTGYNSFIYANYFGTHTISAAVIEPNTTRIIAAITSLNPINQLTLENEVFVNDTRRDVSIITAADSPIGHQAQFINATLLNTLNEAVARVGTLMAAPVVARIDQIPAAGAAGHTQGIAAARAEFNQLVSTRAHYAQFVTNRSVLFGHEIALDPAATAFVTALSALPALDDLRPTTEHIIAVANVRVLYTAATTGVGRPPFVQLLEGHLATLEAIEAKMLQITRPSVTFTFGAGIGLESFVVMSDEDRRVERPTDPVVAGLRFVGWYRENGTAFDFNSQISGDLTLEARFITHTQRVVTLNFNDGTTANREIIVEVGDRVTRPTNPTKDGYNFDGWFVGDTEFNFNNTISNDITLTARWTKQGGCGNCGSTSFVPTDFNAGTLAIVFTLTLLLGTTIMFVFKKRKTN